ncbi:MAG TPA: MBL fold metallo-hydrolase [Actinomycetota bacterium]|jgi:glyoxylase-like metal-dependent hydrolase (beta-lactamase superfamily II)
MKAERFADGVWRVLKGYVNAYVIEGDDGLVLVDTGMPKRADRISESVRDMGRTVGEVRHILVTHHHVDHVGSLMPLADRSGATIHAPAVDAPVIRGDAKPPGPNRAKLSGRTIGPLAERIAPHQPVCRVDVELHDGDRLDIAGGIRVVTSPGHTAGHTSFLLERGDGVLIAADAAGARGENVGPPIGALFGMFTEDLDEAVRSFHKLAALDFDVAITGHGNPVRSGASELFKRNRARFPAV